MYFHWWKTMKRWWQVTVEHPCYWPFLKYYSFVPKHRHNLCCGKACFISLVSGSYRLTQHSSMVSNWLKKLLLILVEQIQSALCNFMCCCFWKGISNLGKICSCKRCYVIFCRLTYLHLCSPHVQLGCHMVTSLSSAAQPLPPHLMEGLGSSCRLVWPHLNSHFYHLTIPYDGHTLPHTADISSWIMGQIALEDGESLSWLNTQFVQHDSFSHSHGSNCSLSRPVMPKTFVYIMKIPFYNCAKFQISSTSRYWWG